jgi:hypothetical protein
MPHCGFRQAMRSNPGVIRTPVNGSLEISVALSKAAPGHHKIKHVRTLRPVGSIVCFLWILCSKPPVCTSLEFGLSSASDANTRIGENASASANHALDSSPEQR